MDNRTEKVTFNLSTVELAQIDFLVERGLYTNRSDFIRSAVRAGLDKRADIFKDIVQEKQGYEWRGGVGIVKLSFSDLEAARAANAPFGVTVIGVLVMDNRITAELVESSMDRVQVYGKIVAPPDVKRALEKLSVR